MKTFIVVNDSLIELKNKVKENAESVSWILPRMELSENYQVIYDSIIFDLSPSQLFFLKNEIVSVFGLSINDFMDAIIFLKINKKIKIIFDYSSCIIIENLQPY